MLGIYGSAHLFKKRKVLERATCPHCGRPNRVLRSHSAWEFLHAYFIPIFPMGTIRAVAQCPTCLRFGKYALKGRRLKAAIAEQRELATGRVGEDVNVTLQDIAVLAHLGDFEGVEGLLEQLKATSDVGAAALANARFLDLLGRHGEAETQFRAAVDADPSSGAPNFWLGRFLLHQVRDTEAIAELQRAARCSPQYQHLSMLVDMIDLRERQKEWPGLAAIMEEVLRLHPDMANTKGFSKLFAKACKKSGRVRCHRSGS